MNQLAQRVTLWFLRRFKLFRLQERQVQAARLIVSEPHANGASLAQVERELEYYLLLRLPYFVDVEVLPTQRVGWCSAGQIRVRIFEGGGPRG